MFIQGVTGPQKNVTGANPTLRMGNSGEVSVADGHGRYTEPTYRGNMWTFGTLYAGLVLIITTSPIAQTGAWAPTVGLYNPVGSGTILSIVKGYATYVSGTTTAGGLYWGYIASPAGVTAAGTNGATNLSTLVVGGSVARTFLSSGAMTGSGVSAAIAPFPVNAFASAQGATSSCVAYVDEVAGSILVPPGAAIGITGTLGTSTIVQAGIVWEEFPA